MAWVDRPRWEGSGPDDTFLLPLLSTAVRPGTSRTLETRGSNDGNSTRRPGAWIVSGIGALLFRDAHDEKDVDRLLQRMEAPVPHRSRGGAYRSVDPWGGLMQLVRRPPSTPGHPGSGTSEAVPQGTLYRHPSTGIEVALHARIDNAGEVSGALGLPPDPPDGALVAEAYLRWGEGFPARLVGDFALALRDPRRRRLLLARDPMSMRPLFFRVEPGRVLAASEVKQLLALPGVPAEVDERMAACYLVGVFGDPVWSYWKGISQLPPGHILVAEPGAVRIRKFWEVDSGRRLVYQRDEQYAEHLKELVLTASRARLPDAGGLGIFLSGGLDSGIAAAAAAWVRGGSGTWQVPIYSYSWDFGDLTGCDERSRSSILVDHFGFHGRDVPVQDAGPLAGYPDEPFDRDDPFHGHFQSLLDRGMAAAAADGVVRLVTGMRGDLAVGPTHVDYHVMVREGDWAWLLRELAIHGHAAGTGLPSLLRHYLSGRVGVRQVLGSLGSLRRATSEPDPRTRIPSWLSPAFVREVELPELIRQYDQVPALPLEGISRQARYQWLFTPMIQRWAVSHERRASTFGLEAVDPWSDRRIAEFAVAIPQHVLDPESTLDKPLAREAMRGILPEAFRTAARKTIPQPLFERGMRSAGRIMAHNLLHNMSSGARGWVSETVLRTRHREFSEGAPLPEGFWWAVSLEWWLRVLGRPDGTV